FILQVEHRLGFCFGALSHRLHFKVANRGNDRLRLDGGGLEVTTLTCFDVTDFHNCKFLFELKVNFIFKVGFRFLCRAPPLQTYEPCARRSAWSARRSASPPARSIVRWVC